MKKFLLIIIIVFVSISIEAQVFTDIITNSFYQNGKQTCLMGAQGNEYQIIEMSGWGIAHGLLLWKGAERAFTLNTGDGVGNLGAYGPASLFVTGNVGIGRNSASNQQGWERVLDVNGANNSKILVTATGETYRTGIYSHASWYGGGGFIGTESNHNLHLITNYTPRMTILASGKVGIGTTDPKYTLDVNGETQIKSNLRMPSGVAILMGGNGDRINANSPRLVIEHWNNLHAYITY